jgi:hypothetical protein
MMSSVDKLMKRRPHVLAGKELSIKRMLTMDGSSPPSKETFTPVMRVDCDVNSLMLGQVFSAQRLRNASFFGKYGNIVRIEPANNPHTFNRTNSVAFLVFADYDSVDRVCLKNEYLFANHMFRVSKSSHLEIVQYEQSRATLSIESTIASVASGWSGGYGDSTASNALSVKAEIPQVNSEPKIPPIASTFPTTSAASNELGVKKSSKASSDDARLDSNNNQMKAAAAVASTPELKKGLSLTNLYTLPINYITPNITFEYHYTDFLLTKHFGIQGYQNSQISGFSNIIVVPLPNSL